MCIRDRVSNIRPAVILRAAAVLANSEVYREEKIPKNSKNLKSIVTDTRNKLIDDCNTDGDLEIVSVSCGSLSGDDARNNSGVESVTIITPALCCNDYK